jgi:tetratricopeptide (TPR) repeat protein
LICGLFSRYPWADGYARLAEKTAREFRDLPMQAAIALRKSVYYASAGQWAQAIAEGQQALRIYQRLEDWRSWGDCLTVLGSVTFLQGRARESITYCAALQELSNTNHNVEHRVWAVCGQGFNLLNLGQTEAALELAKELAPFVDEAQLGDTEEAFYHSLIAVARLRRAENTAALQAANIAAN